MAHVDRDGVADMISFPLVLGFVFITLKLCGVISWPWIWVTAPIWIAPAAILLGAIGLLIVSATEPDDGRKNKR